MIQAFYKIRIAEGNKWKTAFQTRSGLYKRCIAHNAMAFNVLSPQHGGALPKRSAMDLATSFVHDVEMAWYRREHVTMVTMDVQGAFDAVLAPQEKCPAE